MTVRPARCRKPTSIAGKHWSQSLMVTLLAPLLRGQHTLWAGPLGYRDTALYANFWKIVAHYGISAMSAVPTVYAALIQCPIDADISSLRSAIVGASPLPPSVRKDFESHTGIALCEGYGPTEATAASARSFPDLPRPGSVGQRLPYQRAKTISIDDNGRWHDLAVGEVGHLVISGQSLCGPSTSFKRSGGGRPEAVHGRVLDGLLRPLRARSGRCHATRGPQPLDVCHLAEHALALILVGFEQQFRYGAVAVDRRHRRRAHLAAVDRGDPNRALEVQTDRLAARGQRCRGLQQRPPALRTLIDLYTGTVKRRGESVPRRYRKRRRQFGPAKVLLRGGCAWYLRLSSRRASEHPERDRGDREYKRPTNHRATSNHRAISNYGMWASMAAAAGCDRTALRAQRQGAVA